MRSMLKLKRIYAPAAPSDGYRVLVDRLWPRGLSNSKARVDLWMKDIGPSDALRTWFGHDPKRWTAFRARYWRELPRSIRFLLRGLGAARTGGATLTSYLLFEPAYCRALIALGYKDTMARREEVLRFISPGTRDERN